MGLTDMFPTTQDMDIGSQSIVEKPMRESLYGKNNNGIMGVPITFMDKYNPEQFEILGIANSARWIGDFACYTIIGGQKIYNRLLIRPKKGADTQ